jgi:pyruvate dehydrogenase E1 component alpha subunit
MQSEIFTIDPNENPDDLVQVLDDTGAVLNENLVPDLSDDEFVEFYYYMRLTRAVDQRGVSLQRQGRAGTMASGYGQEANVATSYALSEEDWLIPNYREFGSIIARGIDPAQILMYWMGKEPGHDIPKEYNTLSIPTPIATQIPHAAGLAMAAKVLGEEDRAFLCHFGDGATSEGDFHEGLNFASAFDTPNVFVCDNNQYAISLSVDDQTGSETIAQKAHSYGFAGTRVDGMDPLGVYAASKAAVDWAKDPPDGYLRSNLVELVMYRLAAHSTSDDPSKYRSEEEEQRWEEKEPIGRFETFLRETGRLDDEREAEITERIEREVNEAVDVAEGLNEGPEDMFGNVFHEMTPELRDQLEELEEIREEYGDDSFTVDWEM